jgi:hypothetical protein
MTTRLCHAACCAWARAQLLRGAGDSPLAAAPLWERAGLAPAALVGEFQRECRVIRKGVDGDLHKARRGTPWQHLESPDCRAQRVMTRYWPCHRNKCRLDWMYGAYIILK